MSKGRRKDNVDKTSKEVKGKISGDKEIKIHKCSRKSHVETISEEMKERSIEEKEIVIRKCRRRILVYIMKKVVKVWTSSSKQQEAPQKTTKTKEEIRLELTKKRLTEQP